MQKNSSAAQITGSLSLSKTRPDLNCYRVNGESLRQWPIKSEQSGICSWLHCKKVFYELKIDFDTSSKNLHNWPVLKLLNVYFWSCYSVIKMNFSTFKKKYTHELLHMHTSLKSKPLFKLHKIFMSFQNRLECKNTKDMHVIKIGVALKVLMGKK